MKNPFLFQGKTPPSLLQPEKVSQRFFVQKGKGLGTAFGVVNRLKNLCYTVCTHRPSLGVMSEEGAINLKYYPAWGTESGGKEGERDPLILETFLREHPLLLHRFYFLSRAGRAHFLGRDLETLNTHSKLNSVV